MEESSSMRPALLISACCLLLGACAGPQAQNAGGISPTAGVWKPDGYTVEFRVGPFDSVSNRSYSSYEISLNPPGPVPQESIKVESALSSGILKEVAGADPSRQIRTFVSSSGEMLLIEEVLPVIAWPCNNWILVTRGEGGLSYDYLLPPQRQVRPTDDNKEIPRITWISDGEISFRYSDGRRVTANVKDLVKEEKRPEFPG